MKRQERALQEGFGVLKTISTTTATKKKGKPSVVKEKTDEVGKVNIQENKREIEGEVAEVVVMVMEVIWKKNTRSCCDA